MNIFKCLIYIFFPVFIYGCSFASVSHPPPSELIEGKGWGCLGGSLYYANQCNFIGNEFKANAAEKIIEFEGLPLGDYALGVMFIDEGICKARDYLFHATLGIYELAPDLMWEKVFQVDSLMSEMMLLSHKIAYAKLGNSYTFIAGKRSGYKPTVNSFASDSYTFKFNRKSKYRFIFRVNTENAASELDDCLFTFGIFYYQEWESAKTSGL